MKKRTVKRLFAATLAGTMAVSMLAGLALMRKKRIKRQRSRKIHPINRIPGLLIVPSQYRRM